MTVKITIEPPATGGEEKEPVVIELNARRALDGSIMILDHQDIDIIVMPLENKCLAIAKDLMDDKVYGAQDRLFRFLAKRGVIHHASIVGGNIYGSMEAMIMESMVKGVDNVQAVLYSVYHYIKEERPYFTATSKIKDRGADHILHPEDEYSTELGDVPHKSRKGSLSPSVRPYGFQYNYSLIREIKKRKKNG